MHSVTPVKLFATNGSEHLAGAVFEHLLPSLHEAGMEVARGELKVRKFSNENLEVQVDNVRDHIVVVLHTMCPPVNENLIQLMALLDAINNAHPRSIFLVFPCMPYARSDRKNQPRISVMGQRLPEILNKVLGVRRVLLVEPHDPHIKQYFVPTADEVPGVPLLIETIKQRLKTDWDPNECVIVFADTGAARRFEQVPIVLGLEPAYIHKVRMDHSESPTLKGVIGNIKDRHCLLVDDEILTGNTVLKDAAMLKSQGARSVHMFAVHGIFSDRNLTSEQLMQKLANSDVDEFVVTDTVPVEDKIKFGGPKFKVVAVAPLVSDAVKRMILGESISELHRIDAAGK